MLSFGSPVSFIDRLKGTGAILIYQAQSVALQKRLLQTGVDWRLSQENSHMGAPRELQFHQENGGF
jgi:hypothetical protein